ncbi:CHAT domain-containing protein [Kibdelosporangium persicum]|uniref:Lead, cadmium, zinc and mercury transporting ATPase n=1 Tax=Kibdelosporangium persicum TaxID=2698649 RepID=A0ABX2F3G8_9PSEU|nr:CHAT domain-containing protein [Kibdelosporangium persicum]NRN65875.1 Lead, cadmium, zinc and mercury transporting ATPase [Kibdelosporangium persicum]
MTKTPPADPQVILRARELHRAAVDAHCVGRQGEAVRLARQGMRVLGTVEPVDPGDREDWLRARIRLSCSLAALLAESQGLAVGLARLDEVRSLIAAVADPLDRAELTGNVDNNYGVLLLGAGRNEESLDWFESSVAHQELCMAGTADPRPMVDPFVKTLASVGLVCTRIGLLQRARDALTRAIDLAMEYDLPARAADLERMLGTLELRSGDVPAALRRYEECDRVYRGIGENTVALLRMSQAQALLTAGLADEAGNHLDEALPVMREQHSTSRDLADAELYRAAAALLTGDLDLARTMARSAHQRMKQWGCETCVANANLISLRVDTLLALRSATIPGALPAKAVRFADSLPVPKLTEQAATARMLAVRLEIRRGRLDRATELMDRVARPGRLTAIDHRMLRRLCRAELAVAHDDAPRALREIKAGLAELDQVRDRMGGLELLSGTALHGRDLGELAIRLVMRGARPGRLFDWLERTRAQTYRYEPLAGLDNPALAERIAEVRSLTQSVHQARHDGLPTAALQARRTERLREANRLGWHSGRWGRPRPVTRAEEVAEALGDRALMSFVASEDSLAVVVLMDGEVRTVNLGSATEAAKHARMLNVDLNALAPDQLPTPMVKVVSASARKQAERIDGLIGRPLVQVIGDRDLVVVPTGALYGVPWNVLPSMHGRPTVVAPSATAWLAAERATRRDGRAVLVRGLGLPAAIGEIDKLAAHHHTVELLSGDQATVSVVLKALDGALLAHIAAHGVHEPENALFSRLDLADGALFAHEIAGLARPPQQVVLAACELALNRVRPGDEALGFASALLASGSQTVVAPLSKVGDQAAAAAMDDYHRRLAAGAQPAVALADAIAADPYRRPFVCLGSSR